MEAVKYKGGKRATPYDGQKRREQPELPPTPMSIDGEASSPGSPDTRSLIGLAKRHPDPARHFR